MALNEADDGRLVQLGEIADRLNPRLLEEHPDSRPVTDDRGVVKPALASEMPGKVLEDPFACAPLDRFPGRNGIGLAQDRQQLPQRGPVARLRTPESGTIGQVLRGGLFIDVADANLPVFQPAAEVSDEAQTPPCGRAAISFLDQAGCVSVNVDARRPFVQAL
nr:hypothetical protein [Skermanella sp. TT6]